MSLKGLLTGKLKVSTIEKVAQAYYNAGDKPKKRPEILKEWNDLYLPKLKEDLSAEDPMVFLKAILSNDFPIGESACFILAKDSLDSKLSQVSRLEQMSSLSFILTSNYNYNYNITYFISEMRKKWKQLSFAAIEKASTIEGIKAIANQCYVDDPEVENRLISKWISLCKEIQELVDLYDFEIRGHSYVSELIPEIQKAISSILFQEIPKADDVETAKHLYDIATHYTKGAAVILAFEKWLEFCKTAEEADEAYKMAPQNPACIISAYKKVRGLAYNKAEA